MSFADTFLAGYGEKKAESIVVPVSSDSPDLDYANGFIADNRDDLQRRLGNRQIQLIAIGGSIGTALFISIGGSLAKGGPASTFVAYTIYTLFLGLVNNGTAEMTVMMPVSGGFIRLAGHWVDDAWGFMAGWNFFLYEALLIPFEITALCTVLGYWSDHIPAAAVIAAAIVLYAILNILAVGLYGEAEFWLCGGKVILILLLYAFTFITMVGGNPQGDAFGFRYWSHPGAFVGRTSLAQFEGFLASLWAASFCIVGPEYVSMVAGEAKRPRVYIKRAFKTLYWRFGFFFILGSLCVGVLVPSNNKTLVDIFVKETVASGTAAASPYVIAMQILGIHGLPNLVNALLVTSIFSAGNTLTYCSTRSLYALALEGRAPAILRKCTKRGVPIVCFCVIMVFPCLSFLQLSHGSSQVLTWLLNLITAGGIIDYIVMCVTYLRFYAACKAQGLDRRSLPYYGYFQPYAAWIALVWMVVIVLCYGYYSFDPWNVQDFFIYYAMIIVAVVLFAGWKLIKKTKWLSAHEIDLVWERPTIDAYEATFIDEPVSFWREMVQLVGLGKRTGGNDQRTASISA
ncbi:amino acid permease/ SLC12A domain-containing protein [Neohortaea acidophila]|uniref:Amino acid permease/ SLC12A domain-containing protein n=1 Tax=Neohortaea acidophila TaxID=245834 RepID=A0A6A6Q851_9PEZI|nr:amino acid permease/ SLC12A domain-containing protein [Neohortaea acidophila]KAF2487823.1 amino acid permease/ SLC12A domain-containing protein [Neohortaea acidophila]